MDRRPLVLAIALLGGACRDATPAAPLPASAHPPPAVDAVVVRVDGEEIGRVDGARLAQRPRLGELARAALGDATVVRLEAIGRRGARLAAAPDRHPDEEPRLYLDPQGRPSFAWFGRGDTSAARPAQGLVDVATIELATQAREPAAAPSPLAVEIDGVAHTLTGAQLDALPRQRAPGLGRRNAGWVLRDVIALVAPGASPVRVEVLVGGPSVVIDAARLADQADPLTLKRNRRGALNLRAATGPRAESVLGLRVHTR